MFKIIRRACSGASGASSNNLAAESRKFRNVASHSLLGAGMIDSGKSTSARRKGDVATMADKQKADETARAAAGNAVISNELLVTAGDGDRAEKVADNSDDAIESSFKAYVAENKLEDQHVRADAENGVLTLTGDVDTEAQRSAVEKDAAKLPGVTQVVNKLDVKGGKAGKHKATR